MSFPTIALLLILVIPSMASANKAEGETRPDKVFDEAVALMESGRFADSVPLLDALAENHPSANVFWNLGIAASETGNYDKAKGAWLSFRKADPANWRSYVKLIQAYQALGDPEARDAERAALFALWGSGNIPELSAEELYCREQFMHNGQRVYALEYFAPTGEFMVKYAFVVEPAGPKEGFKISLGSYEATNRIARELGEIPKDARLYHLDFYQGTTHKTYGFFEGEPSFDVVRVEVAAVLGGDAKAVSGTVMSGGE